MLFRCCSVPEIFFILAVTLFALEAVAWKYLSNAFDDLQIVIHQVGNLRSFFFRVRNDDRTKLCVGFLFFDSDELARADWYVCCKKSYFKPDLGVELMWYVPDLCDDFLLRIDVYDVSPAKLKWDTLNPPLFCKSLWKDSNIPKAFYFSRRSC